MMDEYLSTEQLSKHLEIHYHEKPEEITKLDLNVYKVHIPGRQWVARVYPQEGAVTIINTLSQLLKYLDEQGYPAERLVSPNAVTPLDSSGRCILVTIFVHGRRPVRDKVTFFRIGRLLGRLHGLKIPEHLHMEGGAWHHLSLTGDVDQEWDAAIQMLEKFAHNAGGGEDSKREEDIDTLKSQLRYLKSRFSADIGLPVCLVHPDLVPSNVVAHDDKLPGTNYDKWTVVDWTGAGLGMRVLSLAYLLAAVASRGPLGLVNAVMKGYMEQVQLEPEELNRLPDAVYARVLSIQCWEVAVGRKEPGVVVNEIRPLQRLGNEVSERVHKIILDSQEDRR